MKANFTVLFSPHETYGQGAAEFTARCFIADPAIEPFAQDVQFSFRHGAF
jgi:hypothetical protein